MKVFILGQSNSGKTSLAKQFAKITGFKLISSSDWIRKSFREKTTDESIDNYNKQITNESINKLKNDPNICFNFVKFHNLNYNNFVIEGIRNPKDFTGLFDYTQDKVIFLEKINNPFKRTKFEEGMYVIRNYISWLKDNDLMNKDQSTVFNFEDYTCYSPCKESKEPYSSKWACCLKQVLNITLSGF